MLPVTLVLIIVIHLKFSGNIQLFFTKTQSKHHKDWQIQSSLLPANSLSVLQITVISQL